MMKERWLPVPISGFEEAYEISDHGRVKSKPRSAGKRRYPVRERILRPGLHTFGYPFVCLFHGGRKATVKIHRLVTLAFIPNPLNLPLVNHKDSNPANNHYSNLEWSDHKHNSQHALVNGRMENNRQSMAKLSWEKVGEIRSLSATGMSNTAIARLFDVTQGNISMIVAGKTWIPHKLSA